MYIDLVIQTAQLLRNFAAAGLSRHRAQLQCPLILFPTREPWINDYPSDNPVFINALEALCRARLPCEDDFFLERDTFLDHFLQSF
jgi:hypothetical protein